MSTIAENLLTLQQAKNDIKSAIESKGQDLTDVPFTEYGNKIGEMSASENLDTELNEQDTLLAELETQVNELSDKPKDMLQAMVDNTNSCAYLFMNYNGTEIDISNLDTSNVTNMYYMFESCAKLKNIVHNLNTAQVTDMEGVFKGCPSLTSIDMSNFDTSKVTTFREMFYSCRGLVSVDISHFKTTHVKNMESMFDSCSKLTSVNMSGLDTSNVTNMYGLFRVCKKLSDVNLSNLDTSACTTMRAMFYSCNALTSLDLSSLNTSNVTDMAYMFQDVNSIETLDLSSFDTRKVGHYQSMFKECAKLKSIIGVIDMVGMVNSTWGNSNMFTYCYALTNVTFKNIPKSLQIGSGTLWGHLLTLDSLLNTIKELWNLTGSTTQTLTVGSANLEKLANVYVKLVDITDEMRAEDEYIDNKLPFVQCESTDEGAMLISEYVTSKNWQLA